MIIRLRDWLSRILLLALLLPLAGSPMQAQNRVIGYHAWWMQDSWQDYDLGLYDKVLFFELPVGPDGSVPERYGWPNDWTGLVEAVHQAGGKVAPTFAILDPATFSSVLGSAENRQRLEDTILTLVRASGADGAHLNFEIFEPSTSAARAGFTQLARSLRERLKNYRSSAELTVFLPGFDHGEAYDELALASVADYLIVQGYDMHWLNAPTAGPVAPLKGWGGASWEGITARYEAMGIDRGSLIMAAPYYGYEWPTVSPMPGAETRGEGVPLTFAPVNPELLPLIQISASERIGRHALQRDPESGSPYYAYRGASGWYQGWFEDRESLDAKYRFVADRGLGGVAVFLLGYDGGRLEPALREAFRRR